MKCCLRYLLRWSIRLRARLSGRDVAEVPVAVVVTVTDAASVSSP